MYQGGEKVNLPRSDSRDVVALHSPIALLETGLRTCPPEKGGTVTPFADEQSILCSPVLG
jgi:hypothetical protein